MLPLTRGRGACVDTAKTTDSMGGGDGREASGAAPGAGAVPAPAGGRGGGGPGRAAQVGAGQAYPAAGRRRETGRRARVLDRRPGGAEDAPPPERGCVMTDKRVVVWVQDFKDRPHLMLQWHDPVTGQRKSKTAGTCNPLDAEKARADLEYELTHGRPKEEWARGWERFREAFEEAPVPAKRRNTQENSAAAFDAFERHCGKPRLRTVTARTLSAFAAGQRALGLAPATVKVRLQLLRAALAWATRQGLIPKVPEFPRVSVPKKRPQPVPAEAFEKLLDKTADPQLRAYLLCGWLAGLRLEEAFRLERE